MLFWCILSCDNILTLTCIYSLFTSHQRGYVFVVVCLLAALHKNFQMHLHEIFREGWQWAIGQVIKFWWQYGSGIWIRIRIWIQMQISIATLVRHVLVEVSTVAVLLVYLCFYMTVVQLPWLINSTDFLTSAVKFWLFLLWNYICCLWSFVHVHK